MIDLSQVEISSIKGVKGFVHNGSVYIDLLDCMNILEYMRVDENGSETYLWSKMYKEFYSALHIVRIDDYGIPLHHTIIEEGIRISEYKMDLPEYIIDSVILRLASVKRDNCVCFMFVQSVINGFKKLKNITLSDINTENKKGRRDAPFYNEGDKTMNNYGIQVQTCKLSTQNLRGFVKDGIIYLNTLEVGFMIGITKKSDKNPNIYKIRWDNYYQYYKDTAASFGDEYMVGYNLSKGSSKRGPKSEYEQKMPEYLPMLVAFGISNRLNNFAALNFRMDVVRYALPFFINNAPKEEIDNIRFLRNVRPLLDEREKQLNIERKYQQQVVYPQYMQYMYFNQNMYNQGMRPAIPNYNPNIQFTGMAYQLADPNEIQKNLDSQTGLKEVVVFGDKAKAMK